MWQRRGHAADHYLDVAADEVGDRLTAALVGDVLHVDAGHVVEQFTGQVADAGDTRGGETDFFRIGLGVGDELLEVLRRQRGMGDKNIRGAGDLGDRCEILHRVIGHFVIKAGADADIGDVTEHHGVTIGGRFRDNGHADVAVGAGAVVDDDLLAQLIRQHRRNRTRQRIRAAARGVGHDKTHRTRRIGLRGNGRGRGQQRGADQYGFEHQ